MKSISQHDTHQFFFGKIMTCVYCEKRIIYTKRRLPNTCSRWKCKNHILCDGFHRSCDELSYERGNCKCWLFGCPKAELKNYCYLCLSEKKVSRNISMRSFNGMY